MLFKKKKTKQDDLFVSIGAGINQIPLIKEVKELGLQIIGVDKNLCAPGLHICDIKIQESIDDFMEIFRKLKELLVDGDITGVLSKSFGSAIKTVAFLANELKIPLLAYNRIDDFISKDRMKRVLNKNNINTPEHLLYSQKKYKNKKMKFEYPFVIKPTIGHAKNEVRLINDLKTLEKHLRTISSKDHEYLAEKYIKGEEVIAVGIVYKSRYYLVELTDKIKSPLPYFVDIMHISPSKYYPLWERIQETGQRIVESFEIYTSPLIMELIITENQEIFVIETAPEFGGEFLSDILIPESTGYNIIRESIKAVIGRNFKPPLPQHKKHHNAVIVKYITGSKGTLLSFKSTIQRSQGILFSKIFKDIGSAVKKPVTNHDRIGVLITKATTIEEAIDIAREAETNLNIRIDKNTGKKRIKRCS